jgi:hypothetical protein
LPREKIAAMKMQPKSRELDKIYKRRDRYDIPDWQREEVWSVEKKQALIDTVLKGWRLPKFYFVKTSNDPEEFEVVDGQQRLNAIFEFFNNDLSLSPQTRADYGSEYYKDLSDEVSDRFDDFEIDYDEIQDATDEELKDFFQRLQSGLPLNSSEKLNAIHSKLRDFVKELSKHRFLKDKTNVSDHRYGHFDVVAKVVTLEIEGIEAGLRFDDIRRVFESQTSFSTDSAIAKRLKLAFDSLDLVFPDRAPQLRNRTLVQALVTFIARFIEAGATRGNEAALNQFFTNFLSELTKQVELGQRATDQDYLSFQRTVSANVKGGARTRQQILLRKLAAKAPGLFVKLSGVATSLAGFDARIEELGQNVAQLIPQINSAYSARNGVDLFKITNQTATTLSNLHKPINGLVGYEKMIDGLYFLLHEGPGSRLQHKPESFLDVNALRTEIRHDVDHGKESDVAKKRKRNAKAFAKYAGSASPQTLSVDQFPMVQYGLLSAIDSDLRKLLEAEGTQIPASIQ